MQLKNTIDKRIEKEILPYFPERIKNAILKLERAILAETEEIRFRAGKPIMLSLCGRDGYLHENGQSFDEVTGSLRACSDELAEMVYRICENSWYAFQEDINKGFVTVRGGHRIGLVGTPVIDNERIINIRDISSLNFRIAREVIGCGSEVVQYLIHGCCDLYNTLIISPPGRGKTTLLRDIIRLISNGLPPAFHGLKVGVIDERGELAACYRGICGNDLGLRTDIIHGVQKKEGMEMLLRSMSPNVIAMDELGNPRDVSTLLQVMNGGVRIIATAHGYDVKQLKNRQGFKELFLDKPFDRFLVITGNRNSQIEIRVLDGDENELAVDNQGNRKPAHHDQLHNGRVCIFPKAYRKAGTYTGNSGAPDGTGQ